MRATTRVSGYQKHARFVNNKEFFCQFSDRYKDDISMVKEVEDDVVNSRRINSRPYSNISWIICSSFQCSRDTDAYNLDRFIVVNIVNFDKKLPTNLSTRKLHRCVLV